MVLRAGLLLAAAVAEPRVRLVGVGAKKTGTTSLSAVCRLLGLREMGLQAKAQVLEHRLDKRALAGEPRPFVEAMREYECFQDAPFTDPALIPIIRKFYPEAKFVLTTRDADAWAVSSLKWTAARSRMYAPYGARFWAALGSKTTPSRTQAAQILRAHDERVRTYTPVLELDFSREVNATAFWRKVCSWTNVTKCPSHEPVPHFIPEGSADRLGQPARRQLDAERWTAALEREAFYRVRFPNGSSAPIKFCRRCHAPLIEEGATQTLAVVEYLAELRRFFADSNEECAGPTQRTCAVGEGHDWRRKGCMRRTCRGDGARLLSGHVRHAQVETPKLRLGPAKFLASDYLDFLVKQLFFADKVRGTFAEAGAIDGVDESVTWHFEKQLRWRGLLVEPTSCALCELPRNRPNATIYNGAICEKWGTFDAATMDDFCSRGHDRTCDKKSGAVPCAPLTEIFLENGFPQVDFLALDVEESVGMALASLDLERVDISVLLVEVRSLKDVAYLQDAGYATLALTQFDDGMRGFLADVVAWRADRFPGLVGKLDRRRAALREA